MEHNNNHDPWATARGSIPLCSGSTSEGRSINVNADVKSQRKLIGDFTVTALSEQCFQLTASFGAQAYHLRWFEKHLPDSGINIANVSTKRLGFQIAGPNARELLSRVTRADVSADSFKFMDAKKLEVGLCDA